MSIHCELLEKISQFGLRLSVKIDTGTQLQVILENGTGVTRVNTSGTASHCPFHVHTLVTPSVIIEAQASHDIDSLLWETFQRLLAGCKECDSKALYRTGRGTDLLEFFSLS